MGLKELYEKLLESGIPVWHYEAMQEAMPYAVYAETSTRYRHASGRLLEEVVSVEMAHVTDREFDPSLEKLKEVLAESKIAFSIVHSFVPETKRIVSHFEFEIVRETTDMGGLEWANS